MLFLHTVEPRTLGLLNTLMKTPAFKDFNLAGGTALALQIGHRMSYDLDLFGNRPFERQEILDILKGVGQIREVRFSKNIFILEIDNIKVDFVNYSYPLLEEISSEAAYRLLSLQDIAAMKISAITGRGRKRDFFDLYFLMQRFPLEEMLGYYQQKYADGNELMAVRSLVYFGDADDEEDLNLFQKVDWSTVKNTIEEAVRKIYR